MLEAQGVVCWLFHYMSSSRSPGERRLIMEKWTPFSAASPTGRCWRTFFCVGFFFLHSSQLDPTCFQNLFPASRSTPDLVPFHSIPTEPRVPFHNFFPTAYWFGNCTSESRFSIYYTVYLVPPVKILFKVMGGKTAMSKNLRNNAGQSRQNCCNCPTGWKGVFYVNHPLLWHFVVLEWAFSYWKCWEEGRGWEVTRSVLLKLL